MSDDWTLTLNSIVHNSGIGLKLSSGSTIHIYENELGWNTGGNAQDDSTTSNLWDDVVSVGNKWADYGGSGVYTIPGSAGNVDHYPSTLTS